MEETDIIVCLKKKKKKDQENIKEIILSLRSLNFSD